MAPPKLPKINMERVNNPPAPPPHAATARSASSHRQIDTGLLKTAGRAPATLIADDLARNPELQEQFKAYSLRDYFDQDGRRRFQNLSLTYAARQQTGMRLAFGSTSDAHLRPEHMESQGFSARAYHLATQALEKDKELIEARGRAAEENLTSQDKVRSQDVSKRQTEFLFLEVPEYDKYLPPGVTLEQILPPDLGHEEEQGLKWKDERMNSSLDQLLEASNLSGASSRTEWLLTLSEIAELMKWIQLWNCAARGYNTPLGVCRSVFCQFILDAGLIGTKEVPYHWAVSLFDAHAKPSRCCPPDASWAPTASFAKSVNRWNLVCILDRIIRQYCDPKTKPDFFKELIAKLREKIPYKYCEPREIKKATGANAQSLTGRASNYPRRTVSTEEDDAGDEGTASVTASKKRTAHTAESQASTQPWLKPPENPISSVDTGREHLKRDRLVCSMLCEPEVMHLMTKYQPLFKSIFDCYAKSGKMAFSEFLQFAVNFRFMPRVASTYVLQYMYESVVCLESKEVIEYRKQKRAKKASVVGDNIISPKSTRGSLSTRKSRVLKSGAGVPVAPRKNGSRLSVATTRQSLAGTSEEPASPKTPLRRNSNEFEPSTPSTCQSSRTNGTVSTNPGCISESKSSSAKRESLQSIQSSLTVTTERLTVGDEPEDSRSVEDPASPGVPAEDSEYDTVEVRHVETFFGVNAFMEAILKVSFSYLAFYGNTVQANASSFAKAVWMLTYIHCMYDHFQQSRTRHLADAEETADSRITPRNSARIGSKRGSKTIRGSKTAPADIVLPNPFAPKQETLENNVNKGMEQNLKKVLDQVDAQLFSTPPRCELEFTFPKMEPKPGPGAVATDDMKGSKSIFGVGDRLGHGKNVHRRKLARRSTTDEDGCEGPTPQSPTPQEHEVKKAPHEEPSVVHGHCQVCGNDLLPNDWGNCQCHGCSAVDSLGLNAMPIHKLLQIPDEDEDSEKKKVEKEMEIYKQPVLEVRLPAGVRPLALNMNMQLSPPPTGNIRQLLSVS